MLQKYIVRYVVNKGRRERIQVMDIERTSNLENPI